MEQEAEQNLRNTSLEDKLILGIGIPVCGGAVGALICRLGEVLPNSDFSNDTLLGAVPTMVVGYAVCSYLVTRKERGEEMIKAIREYSKIYATSVASFFGTYFITPHLFV